METAMTADEEVQEKIVDVWNAFVKLPRKHPDELTEFRHHIHGLQGLMARRELQVLKPDKYPTYPEV